MVIDLLGSDHDLVRIHHLIRDVNRCARLDGIMVRGRRSDDNGRALATVARGRD